MKPFALIATRAEDALADAEHAQFVRATGLAADDLLRIRLEQAPLASWGLDLADVSGVILAGSPFTTSDPQRDKSATQVRCELELASLLDEIMAEDVPLLGACYGVGTLGIHQGGLVDRTHGESAGPITVRLTEVGREDPLVRAAGLPVEFEAFVGHKEAVRTLPAHAALLATGEACPVQMFRAGNRQYATQFHPELDADGLADRLGAYLDSGYIEPDEYDGVVERARAADVTASARVLRGFVELFGA